MNKNILLLSLIFFTLSANAVTRTWDGGGNGVTWEDPLNWDTNTLPCTTCDVVIYYAGVTLNSSVTVNSLLIGQKVYPYNTGGLSISSGATLTASNSGGIGVEVYFNSILSLAGTLNVSGSLTGLLNEGDANFITSLGSSVTISNTTGYGFVNNGNSALQGDMNITNCGAGITNSKTLSISGDIIIDNVTGSGLVNLIDSFGGLSELTINSGGKLSINESDDYGIYTRTKIYNNGEISIENAGTYGISFDSPYPGSLIENNGSISFKTISNTALYKTSPGSLTNSVTGTITVDGAYGGVTGDGVCTNSGIINISNVTLGVGMAMINNASVSIRNCSTGLSTNDFVNNASASLAIAQASINGISMPSGSFDNHGIITIDTCATGMTLYDVQNTFNNTGFLTVRKTVGYGIYSWGAPSKITKFHNTSSGIINVLFAGSVGVSLDGPVTNEGEMNVFDSFFAGILFADKVLNSGTINTARSGQFGLKFSSAIVPDTLRNSASGQIFLVDDAEGFSCSNGLVLNDGLIDISGTASDGLEINKTEFQNSGQLLIDDIGNQGVLIYSSTGAHFNNKLGGTVGISNVGLNGIDCQKKLTNKGSIAIANSAVNGIYNHSTHDTLRNEGSITIINSGDYGFQNRAAADTTLLWNTSTGSILIDNGGDYGLLNYRTNFFNNGLVEIQNSDDGLYFTGGQLSGAPPFEVRNFGKIKVSNSTGDGIVSSGEFSNKSGGIIDVSFSDGYDLNGLSLHNEACGKIKLDGRIYISPGRELLNDGFLVQKTLDTNNINGLLTNNGVFVEYNRLAPVIGFGYNGTKLINNGFLIQPPQGMLTNAFKEHYFVTKGGSPNYTLGSPIWANKAHTLSGATFNSIDQLLSPLASGVTADSLYFTFTDGTCTYDQPVNVNNVPVCAGITQRNALFYGTNSDNWHDRFNWLPNILPGSCTNVRVNAFNDLIISPSKRARARTFEFFAGPGDVFLAPTSSVLNIDATN